MFFIPGNVHDLSKITSDAKLRRKHKQVDRNGANAGGASEVAEATPTAPASMTSADAEADVVTPIGCCRGDPGSSSAVKKGKENHLGGYRRVN